MSRCLNCNQSMDLGHYRPDKKWCNRKCIDEYRKKTGYWKKLYKAKHPEHLTKECKVCGRPIIEVGERNNVNKYCSDSCMYIADNNYKRKINSFEDYRLLMKLKWKNRKEIVC